MFVEVGEAKVLVHRQRLNQAISSNRTWRSRARFEPFNMHHPSVAEQAPEWRASS